MTSDILAIKLCFPPVRSSPVARPHLADHLQARLSGPLILISASAGSGKTTLLSKWPSGPEVNLPSILVSLDSSENLLPSFLVYLAAAHDSTVAIIPVAHSQRRS